MHQHTSPRRRHSHPATKPVDESGRGNVVQDLQSECGGSGGGATRKEEGEKSTLDVYEEAEARYGQCAEYLVCVPAGEDGESGYPGQQARSCAPNKVA